MIENMTETDMMILFQLLTKRGERTAFIISRRINKSVSNCHLRLRILTDRGFVSKSFTGAYHIPPKTRTKVAEALVEYGFDLTAFKKAAEVAKEDAAKEAKAKIKHLVDGYPETRRGTPSSSEIVKEVQNQEEE